MTDPLSRFVEALGSPTEVKVGEDGKVSSASWTGGQLQAAQDMVQVDSMSKADTLTHPDKAARLAVGDPQFPVCVGCGRRPEEIEEYIDMAKDEQMTPNEYVFYNEGTVNRTNGHFACDTCYIAMGSPSSRQGWHPQ